MQDRERMQFLDLGFDLFFRAFPAGLLGGTLMIAYAMISQRLAGHNVWVPLTSIAGTALGDRAVEDPHAQTAAIFIGAGIHATNAVIFAVIFALILAIICASIPRRWSVIEHLIAPSTLLLAVVYALSLMVVMQNVVVPLADPVFSEYMVGQTQFTVEHLLYGLSVGASLASLWVGRGRRSRPGWAAGEAA
jgi:hypothetical protein